MFDSSVQKSGYSYVETDKKKNKKFDDDDDLTDSILGRSLDLVW